MDWRNNLFRLCICLDGQMRQIYFKTESERDEFGAAVSAFLGSDTSAGIVRGRIKRGNAKHNDLPVGITETKFNTRNGVRTYQTKSGKPTRKFLTGVGNGKFKSVHYGEHKSRDQALSEIIKIRLAWIASRDK